MAKNDSRKRRITRKKRVVNGGTRSILRREKSRDDDSKMSPSPVKTRKTVSWHPEVKSPKKKLGRTRSQTRKQRE